MFYVLLKFISYSFVNNHIYKLLITFKDNSMIISLLHLIVFSHLSFTRKMAFFSDGFYSTQIGFKLSNVHNNNT